MSLPAVGRNAAAVAARLVDGHVPQPFAQLVGRGEPEMADLIQVLDAHVAARAARHQQRADRFDVSIGGLRDPRRTTRQRRPCRFDRVELVGLAVPTTLLSVRTIDLDHHQTPTAQMARQPGAVGAGAFHPDPRRRPEPRQPRTQLAVTSRRRRERLDTQHAAVRVDRGRDMHIQMSIDSTRDQARALYDGHRHPFSLKRSRGGTHVPGRRP